MVQLGYDTRGCLGPVHVYKSQTPLQLGFVHSECPNETRVQCSEVYIWW